jgi:hypothetical protein
MLVDIIHEIYGLDEDAPKPPAVDPSSHLRTPQKRLDKCPSEPVSHD